MEYEFDMEAMAKNYEEGMGSEEFEGYDFIRSQVMGARVNAVLIGTFVRRMIDGSYDEVVNAMQKVMALYDADWITEQLENEQFAEEYYEEYYDEDEGD